MLNHTKNSRRQGRGLPFLLGCLLFVVGLHCEAQNLVFNHSFEQYDTCTVYIGVHYPDTGPLGWFSAGGTPDHMISCVPYGSLNGVPLNFVAYQYPQDGDCYGHVTTYRASPPDIREHFMVQLIEPLVIGQQYYASFYASVAWGADTPNPLLWIYTNGIGMTFTTQPRQWTVNDPNPTPWNNAKVYSDDLITDTVGWTLVSGSFVADSAYQYVMLGNPFENANTDTIHIVHPPPNAHQGGVLIDNICVSADPDGCDMAMTIGQQRVDRWSIYPNPAKEWVVITGMSGVTINAHDLQGRMIWKGEFAEDRMLLEVGGWPRGTYVLRWLEKDKQGWFKLMLTE